MDFRTILGTSNKRRLLLLELLYYRRGGWSSDQLLSELDCSLPILLNDIDLINSFKPNLEIIKVKGLYRIVVDNSLSLGNLYADFLKSCPEFQIIEELLYEECENITALSKKLYLSSSNTQRYLKKIEQTLSSAGIELCYRPLRVEGNEGEIRNFYYRFYSERQSAFESTLPKLPSAHYHILERYVQDFVDVNRIHQKYVFEKRLLYNMYISFWRIKHDHTFPEEQLRSAEKITLPQGLSYKLLKQAVREGVELELTPEMLRDTLWLTYSDSIIFSLLHRELALTENPKYKRLFMQHFALAEEFNEMLGNRLTNLNCLDLATVLNNDFYLCNPNGKYLAVLWRNRSVFIEEVSKVYKRGVQKVRDLVEHFVSKYHMYQEADFVQNYVYLLITTEVYSLEWLASQEPLIKILLLSDLTPTEESFLAKQISENIYGNFEIFHFEQLSGGTPNLWDELKSYDCLVTTGSSEGLPDDYPVVVIDPFLTNQSAKWIQDMVSGLSEQREASLVK
ncbi:hypothetical protein IGI39_002676 [Enterococcus sp. AZ135]|uniref:helix-turn-helix domain-containing protein n=1 Tax=unclassified Enterococcus TaxID=2608891 RepID=UPI003F2244A3